MTAREAILATMEKLAGRRGTYLSVWWAYDHLRKPDWPDWSEDDFVQMIEDGVLVDSGGRSQTVHGRLAIVFEVA